MSAGEYTLKIEQGATYKLSLTAYDKTGALFNLTGFTAAMQIRKTTASTAALVELTHSSGITLGGAAGTIDIVIPASVTTTLTTKTAVYDLKITGGGETIRVLKGNVEVDDAVTR